MSKYYRMGTVRETIERLHEDGYNLAEYALRRLIKTEQIHAVYCGKKALVCYSNVVGFLEGTDSGHEENRG